MIKTFKRICGFCEKEFDCKDKRTLFCSLACASRRNAKLGVNVVRYWLGKKRDAKTIEKIRSKISGRKLNEQHKASISKALLIYYDLKGASKMAYRGLHKWVERRLGKAKRCELCGLQDLPTGKKRFFHWANKSRKYKKDLSDWVQLCMKCHKAYDKNN